MAMLGGRDMCLLVMLIYQNAHLLHLGHSRGHITMLKQGGNHWRTGFHDACW